MISAIMPAMDSNSKPTRTELA
eukprot:COSAG06_NODE_34406_length_475_cov_0.582447_2_plen_21_part_01